MLPMEKKRRRVSFSVPAPKEETPNDGLTELQKGLHVVVEGESNDAETGDDEAVETPMEGSSSDTSSEDEDDASDMDSEDADVSVPGNTASDERDVSDDSGGSNDEAARNRGKKGQLPAKPVKRAALEVEAAPSMSSFAEMHLDQRVSWAVSRLGWRRPTAVQVSAIPAALGGRDVLVSAPTGSGKTAAYAIPLVNHLCQAEAARGHIHAEGTCALVLVPTRELASQVTSQIRKLLKFVDGVHVATLSSELLGPIHKERGGSKCSDLSKVGSASERSVREPSKSTAFARTAEVAVGTPASVIAFRREHGDEVLKNVTFVVVDEADLVLSYGHGDDARAALAAVPSTAQAMLVSATLEADGLSDLRKVVLRRPLTVKVTARASDDALALGAGSGASHYFARLNSSVDRFLVTYAMLRLNVISGKVLIFTNHINAAFRLKLFLDKFKLKSAVLNSELPGNSRIHCVEQFNAGIFDILIATDEIRRDDSKDASILAAGSKRRVRVGSQGNKSSDDIADQQSGEENDHDEMKKNHTSKLRGKQAKRSENDIEFGVARGLDFRGVAAVINFDLPESDVSYIHRAGRTARAGCSGTVLTLVVNNREQISIVQMGLQSNIHVGPLSFRMDQIDSFRYRVEDCLRSVTDAAVHDARLADVRREMINSDRLKDYFDDNPMDLDALMHDGNLAKHIPEHLARVPAYLLPPALRSTIPKETLIGGRPRSRRRGVSRVAAPGARNDDPLRTFSASRKTSGSSRDRYQARHGIKKRKTGKGRDGKRRGRK